MSGNEMVTACKEYLDFLCNGLSGRSTGSEGNRKATAWFRDRFIEMGWKTECFEFDAIDWEEEGASLYCEEREFPVLVSPYAPGFSGEGILVTADTIAELETVKARSNILLLSGDPAKEQLMPKNFVFYNPDSHQKIVSLLENSGAAAIICATGKNPSLAGGVYPFPLIEDGDFDIPSVYMKETDGEKLKEYAGKNVKLKSISRRIPGKGYNVVCKKGTSDKKIVITAHIDAKKGTPGAIDNATGVIVLLLLGRLLNDYSGDKTIEIVAFNGEDYYSVPGQMNYISNNYSNFGNILLNINIDGAGYIEGPSAFSLFDLSPGYTNKLKNVIKRYPDIVEGEQWPQGDHSIFLYHGVPAVACSSNWFIENMSSQDITHTPKDNPGIVNCERIIDIANALKEFIYEI